MSEAKTYPIPAGFAEQANINAEQYAAMYLSNCVRQAMQKSPGQMARLVLV